MEILFYYKCTTAFPILKLENVILYKVPFISVNNDGNNSYIIPLIKPKKRYIKLRAVDEFYPKKAFQNYIY